MILDLRKRMENYVKNVAANLFWTEGGGGSGMLGGGGDQVRGGDLALSSERTPVISILISLYKSIQIRVLN